MISRKKQRHFFFFNQARLQDTSLATDIVSWTITISCKIGERLLCLVLPVPLLPWLHTLFTWRKHQIGWHEIQHHIICGVSKVHNAMCEAVCTHSLQRRVLLCVSGRSVMLFEKCMRKIYATCLSDKWHQKMLQFFSSTENLLYEIGDKHASLCEGKKYMAFYGHQVVKSKSLVTTRI